MAGQPARDLDEPPRGERDAAAGGGARDGTRRGQRARREAGLDVSDRITLAVHAPPGLVADALHTHERPLADAVLATTVTWLPDAPAGDQVHAADVDGTTVSLTVTRA